MAPPTPPKRSTLSDAEDFNLLQEIDDSLRAERMARIWKDFGGIIIALSIGIVLATIGWVIWKSHMEEQNLRISKQLLQATSFEQEGKYSDAANTYDQIAQTRSGNKSFVSLKRVNALLNAGQKDKAVALLKEISASNKDDAWRDFAKLQLAALDASPQSATSKTEDTSGAFSYTLKEQRAMGLLVAGQTKRAYEILNAIALAPDAPYSMKERAQKLLKTDSSSVVVESPKAP